MHASSTVRFEEGYRKIAERAKIPGWDQPDADILGLVYSWLCDQANDRWVIIIANADDLNIFSYPSNKCKGSKDNISNNVLVTLLESLP